MLHCCPDFSLVAEWRLLSSCGVWATHCGGFSCEVQALGSWASVLVVLELIYSVACGIFPVQRSNRCPLNCKADSYPLGHQGSPICGLLDDGHFDLYEVKPHAFDLHFSNN